MYISVEEAASKLNLSARTIRNYCANGKIEGAVKIGKTWNIPSDFKIEKKSKKRSILDILKEEKNNKYKGGLYHMVQVEMAYNSNYIEGSTLTRDETMAIFNTSTILIDKDQVVNVDDLIEANNHFRALDYIIDNVNHKLSEKFIKDLHYLLKRSTSDESKEWFNVGDYKLIENEVGGRSTTKPSEVKQAILNLLDWYNNLKDIEIDKIIEFHVRFERIHPFQDENGRVGRLIMFKECLKHNVTPFIILDNVKEFYYRGLKMWDTDYKVLMDTCLMCQDIFIKQCAKYM